MINKIKNESIKKAAWLSMGVGTSFLTMEKSKKYLDKLQQESWLGYVPIPKKGIAITSALATTYLTSLLAKEEDRKYIWFGFLVTMFFIGTNELLGLGNGNGNDGNKLIGQNGTSESTELSREQQDAIMQDLEHDGILNIISSENHIKILISDNGYTLRSGSQYPAQEIFRNEILTIMARMPIASCTLFKNIGNQQLIEARTKELENFARSQGIEVQVVNSPLLDWNQ